LPGRRGQTFGIAALAIDDGRPLWTQPLPAMPTGWAIALDHAGRVIVALLAAAAGAAAGVIIGQRIRPETVWVFVLAASVTACLLSFVLARGLWAVLLGAAAATAALTAWAGTVGVPVADIPKWPVEQLDTFYTWSAAMCDYLLGWLSALWRHRAVMVALLVGVPVVACVVIEMVFARSVLIFATSCFGAVGMVGGVGLLVWSSRPDWAQEWVTRAPVAALVALGLTVAGTFFQAVGQRREKPPDPDDQALSLIHI